MYIGLLISAPFASEYELELSSARDRLASYGTRLELIVSGPDGQGVAASALPEITAAYLSLDVLESAIDMNPFFKALYLAPALAWLQISWSGVDMPVFAQLLDIHPQLVVSTAVGANAPPIATTVLAAMLTFHRGLHVWRHAQGRRAWLSKPDVCAALGPAGPRRDLPGQRLVVFGMGSIGLHVARMAGALQMRVIGVRRSAPSVEEQLACEAVLRPQDLFAPSSVLSDADFVVICAPLTAETEGFFDRRVLALLPPNCYLLNVGRGAIVDTDALVAQLEAGRLAGAYLDVFSTEPLPADSPLWHMPNVLLSPHDSASSQDNSQRATRIFLDNLHAWGQGGGRAGALRNVVRDRRPGPTAAALPVSPTARRSRWKACLCREGQWVYQDPDAHSSPFFCCKCRSYLSKNRAAKLMRKGVISD